MPYGIRWAVAGSISRLRVVIIYLNLPELTSFSRSPLQFYRKYESSPGASEGASLNSRKPVMYRSSNTLSENIPSQC